MYRRVTLVVADGLRPDAVTPAAMPSLYYLGRDYARPRYALTVRPSATVAALASLATGVRPETHGLLEPGLGFLGRTNRLRPFVTELRNHGLGATVVTPEPGVAARQVVKLMGKAAGVDRIVMAGRTTAETAFTARRTLAATEPGFVMVYLPACDHAGHAAGWMSPEYVEAASELDRAIGSIATAVSDDLLIVVSDHGGGGVHPRDHDQPHPLNERITMVVAGPNVGRSRLIDRAVSILDVPPTILWALGVAVPDCYEGRVIREAFLFEGVAA